MFRNTRSIRALAATGVVASALTMSGAAFAQPLSGTTNGVRADLGQTLSDTVQYTHAVVRNTRETIHRARNTTRSLGRNTGARVRQVGPFALTAIDRGVARPTSRGGVTVGLGNSRTGVAWDRGATGSCRGVGVGLAGGVVNVTC
jgi:hypothetical protein